MKDNFRSALRAIGRFKLLCFQHCAAAVALVAARRLPTYRADPGNEPVGQYGLAGRAEGLRRLPLIDELAFIERPVKITDKALMLLGGGFSIAVKAEAEFVEYCGEFFVLLVADFLRGASLLPGADGDGRAVAVAA